MYAKSLVLHTNSRFSEEMYAGNPVLHTSPEIPVEMSQVVQRR